jgi:fumarate reductase subunit C
LKSYKEIIKDDTFETKDNNYVDTELFKMCWKCERKYKSGYMVRDVTKLRKIFFCEECFAKLKV